MAPYAIGHLKMGFILDELGYHLQDEERFKLYLTNTLEMEELEQTELPGMSSLSEESKAAGKVKKQEEVLVILGNPPYSDHSANNSMWIDDLLKEGYTHENGHEDDGYYFVDGKPLGERNPKWLQDDYVKFIRFAQWKIDQYGQGIVGFITNHSYLDNPTFRGIRESLTKSFDDIRLLDLHGNSLKKETTPDGSKDENVFDIRAGVSITLLKKSPPGRRAGADKSRQKWGRWGRSVQRADLYGLRNDKYEWLDEHHIRCTSWNELKPQSPFYFFKEQDYELNEVYQKFISVNDLFPVNSVGIVTSRDDFVIDFDKESLVRRLNSFRNDHMSDEEISNLFGIKSTGSWSLSDARKKFRKLEDWKNYLSEILYRPFDIKKMIYHSTLIERSRKDVMQHMIAGENLSLNFMRQVSLDEGYSHSLVSNKIVDNRTFSSSKGIIQQAPLYLYPEAENGNGNSKGGGTMMMVFEDETEYEERRPNINKEFYALLEHTYTRQTAGSGQTGERTPTPEQILYYTYAVLYAPAYRQSYAEFLKSDFPRVPFTKDYKLFCELAELGKVLTELHLMKSDKLNDPIAKFQGKGSNVIAKPKRVGRNYQSKEERVYINKDEQYFEGIPPEIWEYQVGGYQVLDKWLYDRRERKLSSGEIQHYCKVATALHHTIELQKQVDELYAGVEDDVVEM